MNARSQLLRNSFSFCKLTPKPVRLICFTEVVLSVFETESGLVQNTRKFGRTKFTRFDGSPTLYPPNSTRLLPLHTFVLVAVNQQLPVFGQFLDDDSRTPGLLSKDGR